MATTAAIPERGLSSAVMIDGRRAACLGKYVQIPTLSGQASQIFGCWLTTLDRRGWAYIRNDSDRGRGRRTESDGNDLEHSDDRQLGTDLPRTPVLGLTYHVRDTLN